MRLTRKIDCLVNWLRIKKLILSGARIGDNVTSHGPFMVAGNYSKNLVIGDNTTINAYTFLNCRDKLIIGKNVHISSGAQIHTGGLYPNIIPRKHFSKQVVIGDNVWIASSVVVSAGVCIGDNSIVAAGSVVTKTLEANGFYAGVPAIKLREIIIEGERVVRE